MITKFTATWATLVLSLFLTTTTACIDNSQGNGPPSQSTLVSDQNTTVQSIELKDAFPELSFDQPVDLQTPRDGTNRLFVVEKKGKIKVFENNSSTEKAHTFLDITSQVRTRHNEEGLLGLAFHPQYKKRGYFYVNYNASGPRRTIISRFKVDPDNPNRALRKSETLLLEFKQPWGNHNGGQVSFGPRGYLYIATGDGGAAGDPLDSGQSLDTLLGKILRIDVDRTSGGRNYAIPQDNPFRGQGGVREEIFAYGLRNPWRFSFDAKKGDLWAADVGQNKIEEVDIVEKGKNYGWNIKEGTALYRPRRGMKEKELIDPVFEYPHRLGVSITGGFVYRGSKFPALQGVYLCADFYTGRIWGLIKKKGKKKALSRQLERTEIRISSFGQDSQNELYMCAFYKGKIYTIQSVKTSGE